MNAKRLPKATELRLAAFVLFCGEALDGGDHIALDALYGDSDDRTIREELAELVGLITTHDNREN